MTHLLDRSEIFVAHQTEDGFLLQFFTKESKYVLSDTVILQIKDTRDEMQTTVAHVYELPFKKDYKLITLKEKQ